jgi:hypothetical protein
MIKTQILFQLKMIKIVILNMNLVLFQYMIGVEEDFYQLIKAVRSKEIKIKE